MPNFVDNFIKEVGKIEGTEEGFLRWKASALRQIVNLIGKRGGINAPGSLQVRESRLVVKDSRDFLDKTMQLLAENTRNIQSLARFHSDISGMQFNYFFSKYLTPGTMTDLDSRFKKYVAMHDDGDTGKLIKSILDYGNSLVADYDQRKAYDADFVKIGRKDFEGMPGEVPLTHRDPTRIARQDLQSERPQPPAAAAPAEPDKDDSQEHSL